MKIQISFVCKKINSVFNENTNQFLCLKKIRSEKFKYVFNKNTDQFLCVISNLYLMKIQISFYV